MFSLEKLRGSLIIGFKYLIEGCKENELRLFWVAFSGRTKGNRHKYPQEIHYHKETLSTVRVTEHWNRPFWEIRVPHLGDTENLTGHHPWQSVVINWLSKQWGWTKSPKIPYNLNNNIVNLILWISKNNLIFT